MSGTARARALLPADYRDSAAVAGLKYVRCGGKGIVRKRAGTGFAYFASDGTLVRDKQVLQRIRSLVLPPAWDKVWICPCADGHLQATGIDAKGRRQYRYHAQFREIRNHTKFYRMLDFAKALPGIRSQVNKDLSRPGLTRPKVVAAVVRLLETTFIRVGNEEYARENSSFGLTTLRDKHVRIQGDTLRFHFRGKSAQMHDISIEDRRLARIVRDCRDLPGYELFQYKDEFGELHGIDSSDVNGYLKDVSGQDFTAKDFRTWAGTIQTALVLAAMGPFDNAADAKRNIVEAIKQTAARLGNRPATCRNYYVHPAVPDAYVDGSLVKAVQAAAADERDTVDGGLHPEEACVIRIVRRQAATPKAA